MESAVKGVRRTFILTLDSTLHHHRLELGPKLNTFLFSHVLVQLRSIIREHVVLAFLLFTAKMVSFDPRCRASIRTQYGLLWARCILGSDLLRPRPVIADGSGLLGAAI